MKKVRVISKPLTMYTRLSVFLCMANKARKETNGVDNSVKQVALLNVRIMRPTINAEIVPKRPIKWWK